MELKKEIDFFHFISGKTLRVVSDPNKNVEISRHKSVGDFATQLDVDVENLIVNEIKKRFPNDQILAEEGHENTKISQGRIWIIDPICGTNNLVRGIKNFCTNIALADDHTLIASCVIDHSQNEYFWSVGEGKIYINHELFGVGQKRPDTVIEIDFGAVLKVDKAQKEKHNRFLRKLVTETNFHLISLNTSLGFMYTAVGKVDGFVNVYNHPWDICASSFLVEQSGGIISDLLGKPWAIDSVGAIAANNKDLHKKLLEAYLTI